MFKTCPFATLFHNEQQIWLCPIKVATSSTSLSQMLWSFPPPKCPVECNFVKVAYLTDPMEYTNEYPVRDYHYMPHIILSNLPYWCIYQSPFKIPDHLNTGPKWLKPQLLHQKALVACELSCLVHWHLYFESLIHASDGKCTLGCFYLFIYLLATWLDPAISRLQYWAHSTLP